MKREEIKREYFTLSIVPQACSSLEAMEKGKQVHSHIIKSRFDSDVFVGCTLIDMCSKFEALSMLLIFLKRCQNEMVSHGMQWL